MKSLGKEGREIHFFKKADTKKTKKKAKGGKKLKKNSDIKREKTATNLIVRNE